MTDDESLKDIAESIKEGCDFACNHFENTQPYPGGIYGVCQFTVESSSGRTLSVEFFCTVTDVTPKGKH